VMADTVLGRLAGIRRVPFIEGVALATGGSAYGWMAEGGGTPVGRLAWQFVSLALAKAAGALVFTGELVRSSAPGTDDVIARELHDGLVAFHDQAALSADPAVLGVSPAGLLAGVAGDASSGATEAALRADLRTLLGGFTRLDGVHVVASEANIMAMATSLPGGGGVFDGRLFGLFPLIPCAAATDRIIAVRAPDVLLADDGGLSLDTARHASIVIDPAPDTVAQAPGAPPVMTSLWQRGLVAVKVVRPINWSARAGAVRVITGAAYV
jgi:hypothetical protein